MAEMLQVAHRQNSAPGAGEDLGQEMVDVGELGL